MATKTVVQIQSQEDISKTSKSSRTSSNKIIGAVQQYSSISLMLQYDIDNTINTIKENGHLIRKMSSFEDSSDEKLMPPKKKTNEINNNNDLQNERKKFPLPEQTTTTTARKRWKILAKVLRKDSEETLSSEDDEELTASVRRFKSFDLLQQDIFQDHIALKCLGKADNWYTYKIPMGLSEYSVNIHHIDRQVTAADLMGFNNTGNVCVWPSEEALTIYALAEIQNFDGKWILELGGGMTCLTGLMLSKYAKPYAVHLTDGNEMSVENVKKTVCLNELSCYTKCSVLQWEDVSARSSSEFEKFDTILSADCLFFDEARSALVDTIWYYLAIDGEALIMAPKRGKTLAFFVDECLRKKFIVEIVHNYNEVIWQRHMELQSSDLYDEDIHYPVLIKLKKTTDCCFEYQN